MARARCITCRSPDHIFGSACQTCRADYRTAVRAGARMTRKEQITKARELRAQGLALKQIAEAIGVGDRTIGRWLNSDSDEVSRECARRWKQNRREQIAASDARRQAGTRCKHCNKLTGAIDEVGDPCCRPCKTARAKACGARCTRCGEALLVAAELCGFCLAEDEEMAA